MKCVCQYCDIPLQEADNHLHKCKYKTEPQIKKMVEKGDLEGLQNLSQHYLWNAFWDLPFHKANKRGIHGACPMDLLHHILLGIFKYTRNIFFDLIGPSSNPAKDINGLSKEYGRCFARQSDASIPNARFSKGIQEGKLMGKEYRGILLLMLVMLESHAGSTILRSARSGNFKTQQDLDDWKMMVELLLLWEAYLLEPEMLVSDLRKLEQKNRYIMYIMRKVARRQKGMGLKLMKFHGILHLKDDILLYGVPLETDTSSNEMHHKPMKLASKLTQMAHSTFNLQTAQRMMDFEAIDLAMLELEEGLAIWDYYKNLEDAFLEPEDEGQEAEIQDMEVSFDESTPGFGEEEKRPE